MSSVPMQVKVPTSIAKHPEDATDEGGCDLARRVKNQLYRLPELRRVRVDVHNGQVVLYGRVSSFYQKQLCISGSQRVAGVYGLVDNIEVASPRAAS